MSINKTPNERVKIQTILPNTLLLTKTPNQFKKSSNHDNLQKDLDSLFNQLKLDNSRIINDSCKEAFYNSKPNNKTKAVNNNEDNDDDNIGNMLMSINEAYSNEKTKKVIKNLDDINENFSALKKETIMMNYDEEVNYEREFVKAKLIDTILLSYNKNLKNDDDQKEEVNGHDIGEDFKNENKVDLTKKKYVNVFTNKGYNLNSNERRRKDKAEDDNVSNDKVYTNTTTPIDRMQVQLNGNRDDVYNGYLNEKEIDKDDGKRNDEQFCLLEKETQLKKYKSNNINDNIYTNVVTPLSKTPNHLMRNYSNNNNNNIDNDDSHMRKINIIIPEPTESIFKQEVTKSRSSKNIVQQSTNDQLEGVIETKILNKGKSSGNNSNNNENSDKNNKVLRSFRLMTSNISFPKNDIQLITNLEPIYTPEIPYSVLLLSRTSQKNDIINKEFFQKRNAFLSNHPFSPIISSNENKSSSQIKTDYQKLIKDNFTSIKNQYNFLFMAISAEEKTALHKLLIDSSNIDIAQRNPSHLSHIYDKQTFSEMFNYYQDESSISFDHYRLFEANGDSFYCAFMFSYIEHLLINKKQTELLALFIDVFRLKDCNEYVYKLIKIREAMIFFSIMSDLIQSNQFKEAYHLFISAYVHPATKQTVEDLLVSYLKWCLFALQYDSLFSESKSIEDNQIKKHKTKCNRNAFKNYNILKPYMEPNIIVFQSIPYAFNVNLKIYWIEGDNRHSSIELCEFNYKSENKIDGNDGIKGEEKDKNKEKKVKYMTINIGYFYTGYHCVYINNEITNNEIFEAINTLFLINPHQVKTLEGRQWCSKCNQSNIVIFDSINKGICYECLMTGINYVLVQRAKNYVQDTFLNLECKHKEYNQL